MVDDRLKRKPGRRPKLGKDETFQVTLPIEEHDYLVYLATMGRLGTSVPGVAEQILIQEINRMLRKDFHLKRAPKLPPENAT